ncbi:MAG: hypothetical protein AAGH15_01040 [Myxococcota bacterium]
MTNARDLDNLPEPARTWARQQYGALVARGLTPENAARQALLEGECWMYQRAPFARPVEAKGA